MAYFPMYVDLTDQDCLIVGGGMVAYRKLCILLDFDARVKVVSEAFVDVMIELAAENEDRISLVQRPFEKQDLDGMALVIAATNQHDVNAEISRLCKERRIPVNAVDQKEDCSFIFPSYVKQQNLVASFSSSGNSPLLTQKLKTQAAQEMVTPLMGVINECLGRARALVKAVTSDGKKASTIYEEIYCRCLEEEKGLSDEMIEEIINQHVL